MASEPPGAWPAQPGQTVTTAEPGPPLLTPPGFRSLPPPPPGPANPDPPATTAAAAGDEDQGAAAAAAPRSTRTSIEAPAVLFRGRAKTFTKLAETGFKAVSGLLNRFAAVDVEDQSFLPDDDDLKMVPPPIGRLAARHVELPVDAEGMSDAEDMIAAAIALGAWGIKGIVDALDARRAARRATAPGTVVAPSDEAVAQ